MSYKWVAITAILIVVSLALWLIYRQIREHYAQKDPVLIKLKTKMAPLFHRDVHHTGVLSPLNNRDIMSEVSFYRGEKSYTINKEKVYMCLKDSKNGGGYYDEQTLMYVLLHEISHVICPSIGHTDEFNEIFDALLAEAVAAGIYDPKTQVPLDYCENGDPGADDFDPETFEAQNTD